MQIEKLSSLVEQRVHIVELLSKQAGDRETIQLRRARLASMLGSDTYSYNIIQKQIAGYDTILSNLDAITKAQTDHIVELDNMINEIREWLVTRAWYKQNLGITDETRKEWTALDFNAQDELLARVSVGIDWHTPCLLVNCYNHEVATIAAKSFQLYLGDIDDTILNNARDRFVPSLPASAVRLYNIKSYEEPWVAALPQQQFGMIIVWQIFERLTLPMIKSVLSELIVLLKPGGKILFNINDCDTALGARLATYPVSKSYVTRGHLEPMVQELGFTMEYWIPITSSSALVELKILGEITTLKERPGRGLIQRYQS